MKRITMVVAAALLLADGAAMAELIAVNGHHKIKKSVEYHDGDTVLQGYLSYWQHKQDKTRRPGVLVVHQWKGLGEFEKHKADALANMEYIAFAVDIYGKDVRPDTSEEAGKQAGTYKGDRELFRRHLNAGLEQLRQHPLVDPDRIAAIGYCFGGTGMIELARSGAEIKGVVSFHGGLDSPSPDDGANIKAKLLVLHGADDPTMTRDDIAAFQDEMRAHEVDWQMIYYGGAVHSFTDPKADEYGRPQTVRYDGDADRRSWAAMEGLFREVFANEQTE